MINKCVAGNRPVFEVSGWRGGDLMIVRKSLRAMSLVTAVALSVAASVQVNAQVKNEAYAALALVSLCSQDILQLCPNTKGNGLTSGLNQNLQQLTTACAERVKQWCNRGGYGHGCHRP
jgi:hypothetical protein